MQDIGEDQLLMLLLVMDAKLDHGQNLRRRRLREQPLHGLLDVLAITQHIVE